MSALGPGDYITFQDDLALLIDPEVLASQVHLHVILAESVVDAVVGSFFHVVDGLPGDGFVRRQVLGQLSRLSILIDLPSIVACGIELDHLAGVGLELMLLVYGVHVVRQRIYVVPDLVVPAGIIPDQVSILVAGEPVHGDVGGEVNVIALGNIVGHGVPLHLLHGLAVRLKLRIVGLDLRHRVDALGFLQIQRLAAGGDGLVHGLHHSLGVYDGAVLLRENGEVAVFVMDAGILGRGHVLLVQFCPGLGQSRKLILGIGGLGVQRVLVRHKGILQVAQESLLFLEPGDVLVTFQLVVDVFPLDLLSGSAPEGDLQGVVLLQVRQRGGDVHAAHCLAVDHGPGKEPVSEAGLIVVVERAAHSTKENGSADYNFSFSHSSIVFRSSSVSVVSSSSVRPSFPARRFAWLMIARSKKLRTSRPLA